MIYIQKINRLRGIPISFISDMGTQLTSYFLSLMQYELGTQLEITIPFYLYTNGQLNLTIQVLDDMICAYVFNFNGY